MKTLNVTASRWSGGWELEISPTDHTQVTRLSKAHQQVLDYLDTMYEDEDHTDWVINIIPDNTHLTQSLAQTRATTEKAIHAQTRAARKARATVKDLLTAGYSQADAAVFMGISRSRVSQLAKEA